MNRVAVTGMGVINSISKSIEEFNSGLKNMNIGIDMITQFDTTEYPVKIAAEVKDFVPKKFIDRKLARKYDRFLQFASFSASQALKNSGIEELETEWRKKTAVIMASGIGGVKTLQKEYENLQQYGPRLISPFLIPMLIPDMSSGAISMEHGIKGPNFSTISACASSLHAIAISTMMIKHGYCDYALTGGAEAIIDPIPVAGFANMMALSRRNDSPSTASRPFDKNRDGFVIGEGGGAVFLESEQRAVERGAKIYGYITGFGMTGDAYDFSASEPDGESTCTAMLNALEMAGKTVEQVDLINCHATSTPVGDVSELKAIRKLIEKNNCPYIQSTKSLIGHTVGAAGVNELIACVLQAENGFIHGNASIEILDVEFEGMNIPVKTIESDPKVILKNAFGFGGHNVSVVFEKA